MKNLYKIILQIILSGCLLAAHAQTRTITGTVLDKDGPLPGATIVEKGLNSNGVSTSIEGNFSITLKGYSNVLIIRSVGYITKEVNVARIGHIKIILAPDAKGLEEVVVVGYGTQKKINVTGAVSSISGDEVRQTPSASLQNALTGKLTGFSSQQQGGRPGADGAKFYVRGVSTFNGTGDAVQPLILVDDVQFSYADFANIDPNEVQSISVLKDAATTAPYGVKGANGVILVTTRRGSLGAARINLRSEFGLQMPTHTPQFLDAATTATLYNEATLNDAKIAGPAAVAAYVPYFSDADIQKYRDGSDPYGHPNVNWYNTLFKKTSPINKNNLDLSGGTESVKYFVSVGYESQGGDLRDFSSGEVNNNFDFNRFNFRSNLDIKATKSLGFKVDISGNTTMTNSPVIGGTSGSAETAAFYEVSNYESLSPYIYNIYNPDGSFGYTDLNRTPPSGETNNIVGRLTYGGYKRVSQSLINFNVSGIQKLDFITPGLQAKVLVAVSNSETSTRTLSRTNFPSFYYNPADGTYTPRNANIYRFEPYNLSYGSGNPRRQSTVQANLNYAHSFGKHNVSGLVLYNQNTQLKADLNGNGADLATSYIPSNIRGLSGRVTYNYSNRYLIEFDGSYNGSDKFYVTHRFGFFPAASAGWVVSEEGFVKKNLPFLNLLKFRASLGIVGSDNLGTAANFYEENFNRGGQMSFGETGTNYNSIVPGTLGNNNVTWEKERKLDLGMDFSMFNGKVTGALDYFNNRRYDILAQRNTIAELFGIPDGQLPPENLGVVNNRGYEIELGYNGKISKDLSFNLKGNFSYVKNKILDFDEVPQIYPYQTRTGQSIGSILIYKFDGYYTPAEAADPSVPKFTGSSVAGVPGTTLPGFLKYHDYSGDGVITVADQGYFGKPNLPTTTIGLNTGFTYKRFSCNILLQSALDYDLRVGYVVASPFKANLTPIDLLRYTPETAATAQFPTLISNFQGSYMSNQDSSYWTVSGNYLRIKSVDIGYRLPEKFVSKLGLKGVRVYANAYDLYTWSASFKHTGLDPEVANQGSASSYDGVYPQSTIVNLGLNVSLK